MSLSDTHNRISRRRQSKLVHAARGEVRAWGKAEDAPAADIALYDAMRTLTHTTDISALFVLLGKHTMTIKLEAAVSLFYIFASLNTLFTQRAKLFHARMHSRDFSSCSALVSHLSFTLRKNMSPLHDRQKGLGAR